MSDEGLALREMGSGQMRDEVGRESGLEVIYDGQCRLCRRSLDIVQRLSGRKVFRLHDANDREMIRSNFRMLADADTENAMFLVTPRGEVFRGFFAYRRMMWESPRLYPFLPLFYAPGAALIGPWIYAWVARNRRNLGCSLSSRRPCGDAGRDGSAGGDGKQPERLAQSSSSGEVYPPHIDALPVSPPRELPSRGCRRCAEPGGRFRWAVAESAVHPPR